MRHRIVRFATLAVAAVLILAASTAWAQSASTVLTVRKSTTVSGEYTSVQAAITDALTLSRTSGHIDIYVYQGEYKETLSIPASADISLIAIPRGLPWLIVLDATPTSGGYSTNPVVTIDASLPTITGVATSNLLIEGFELRGGAQGVHIKGTASPAADAHYMPTLSRCYIRKNQNNGVFVEGDAEPMLVNCSIVENGAAGVQVNTSHSADSTRLAEILHCTLALNAQQGIYVRDGQNARVRNSLVYRNGPDTAGATLAGVEGGVVWDNNLFIVPDSGPVIGGTTVTIYGTNIGTPTTAQVYFGPPSFADLDGDTDPDTLWSSPTDVTGGLRGMTPPSYLGAPGPVDVYLVREEAGIRFETMLPQAYTYISDNTSTTADDDANRPVVARVSPQHGPPEGGNWITVYGMNFDRNCRVGFDFYPVGPPPGDNTVSSSPYDERSPRVEWISSGEVRCKVPSIPSTLAALPTSTSTAAPPPYNEMLNVIVENPDSGLSSAPPAGRTDPLREYEYRWPDDQSEDETIPYAWQPHIVQITPNFFRTPEGSLSEDAEPAAAPNARILGWNFEGNCVVKIGNTICPYTQVVKGSMYPTTSTAWPNTFDEIQEVEVPVAEYGTGGSYDLEVINPTGHHDVLSKAVTYYSDGIPRLDPEEFDWRPANFRLYQPAAGTQNFRLLGTGFDTGITVTFNPTTFDPGATTPPPAGNDIVNVPAYEARQQHLRHTQRYVEFAMPDVPDNAGAANGFTVPFSGRSVPLQIWNHSDFDGGITIPDDTGGALPKKTDETNFVWATDSATITAGQALFFRIDDVRRICEATTFDVDVYNWKGSSDMAVYIDSTPVPAAAITPATAGTHGTTTTITIALSSVSLPHGLAGPVDITVAVPITSAFNGVGVPIYYVAEDALFLDPPAITLTNDHAWRVTARSVEPRVVPTPAPTAPGPPQKFEVHIYGSSFHGPAFPPASGKWTEALVVLPSGSRVSLAANAQDWNGDGTPDYEIVSTTEIVFVAFDATAAGIPTDTALDLVVQNICGGTVLSTDTITGAIVFSSIAGPEINNVYVTDPPPGVTPPPLPEYRYGTVRGGTSLAVTGDNFYPALTSPDFALPPEVFIGSTEGLRFGAYTTTGVTISTPPAPEGLPGTYPVSLLSRRVIGGVEWPLQVVAPRDLWFTYVMDGAPHITSIDPNHVDATATDTGDVFFTIYGTNFDDRVEILIDSDGDGVSEILPGDAFYSVSPFEIVAIAPAATGDLGLVVGDGETVETTLYVRNRTGRDTGTDYSPDKLISNGVPFYYFRGDSAIEPRIAEVTFNDAYLNTLDYVNVNPGMGCISVDPMLDPGATAGLPGPKYTPATASEWWLGKLAIMEAGSGEADWNPLCDKAQPVRLLPYTQEDLEFETRPQRCESAQGTGAYGGQLPDIGADEVPSSAAAAGDVIWYDALVDETQLPVGALSARTLHVEASIRGALVGTDMTQPVFFVLPQGVDAPGAGSAIDGLDTDGLKDWVDNEDDVADDNGILLEITDSFVSEGDAQYVLTNARDIRTVIDDADGDEAPSAGDILADGHAAIFLWADLDDDGIVNADTEIIGFNEDDPSDLTDKGLIERDARAGRHFLIDTVPPRIYIESTTYGADGLDNVITADMLVLDALHNDVYTAGTFLALTDPATGLPTHPYAPIGATVQRDPGSSSPLDPYAWSPSSLSAPRDYLGQIFYPRPPDTDDEIGTQIFFNVGSTSGLYGAIDPLSSLMYPTDLTFNVRVEFIDPNVLLDDDGAPVPALDIFLGESYPRQVAGFADLEEEDITLDDATLPAYWRIVQGRAQILRPEVNVTGDFVAAGTNEGFVVREIDPDNAAYSGDYPGEEFDGLYGDELTATWNFASLPWALARENLFHVATEFIAVDSAANQTGQIIGDPTVDEINRPLKPLHLWWLIDVQTEITPNEEGKTLHDPVIRWNLSRFAAQRLQAAPDLGDPYTAGPVPIYSYRFFQSNEYNGVYSPVDVWSSWFAYPPDYSAAEVEVTDVLPGDLEDQWILVVVASADEAGNVEPWPADQLGATYSSGDITSVTVLASNGQNWQRFYLGGENLPDTKVEAEFWYDLTTGGATWVYDKGIETLLGAAKRMPVAPADSGTLLAGGFTITAELSVPREEIDGPPCAAWSLAEEGVEVASGVVDLRAVRRNQVVLPSTVMDTFEARVAAAGVQLHYTLTATVFLDKNENMILDDVKYDPSPASYSFVVLPQVLAADQFNRQDSEDTQPVKMRTER